MSIPKHVSLFEMSKDITRGIIPTIRCSKVTLVHLSHTLEDIVLDNNLHAMMFTGFQESSHWMKETERYTNLANTAKQVCIFAGKPLPEEKAANAIQIELQAEDPLRQEWFVIILSESFNVILCGQDHETNTPYVPDSFRTFETILSFDAEVINRVLDQLEDVIQTYRPDLLDELQKTRQHFEPFKTDPQYYADIITEFVDFEEQINQQMRYKTKLNEAMISSMNAFTLILNPDMTIMSVNPALQTACDRTLSDIFEQSFLDICIPPDSHLLFQQVIDSVVRTGQGRKVSTTMLIDDDLHHIDWDVSLMYLDNAQENIFLMGHDVTERVLLAQTRLEEAEVKALLENERELNALRSQFITTVSHEFRTPLAGILNSAEMLENHFEELGENGRQRRLDRIKDQVQLLTSMVEEISIAMAASKRSLQFSPTPCYINEIAEDIVSGMNPNLSVPDRINFITYVEQDHIIADTRLLRFIISNLVTNALKYSPDDYPVMLTLSVQENRLIITVSDQGDGIPEDEQKYIFDAFYRGSNVGNQNGTGMGLRIVTDCVAIYEGRLDYVTSENGTTFAVKLPIPDSI